MPAQKKTPPGGGENEVHLKTQIDYNTYTPGAIRYCIGRGQHDANPAPKWCSGFRQFASICLKQAGRDTQSNGRYVCGPLNTGRLNENGNYRWREAVEPRRWIAADIDGASEADARAVQRWANQFECFGHYTRRDKPETRRFRIYFALEREVTRDEGIAQGRWITEQILSVAPSVKADDCCFRPEQPCYLPLVGAGSWRSWEGDEPLPCVMPLHLEALRVLSKASKGDALRAINARPLGLSAKQVAAVLQHLPDSWTEPGAGRWYRVMMAVSLELGHTEDAYAIVDEYLQTKDGYDAEQNRKRWDSGFAHAGDDVITFRSLLRAAKANGLPTSDLDGVVVAGDDEMSEVGIARWLIDRFPDRYLNVGKDGPAKERDLFVFEGRVWTYANDGKELRDDMQKHVRPFWEAEAVRAREAGREEDAERLGKFALRCEKQSMVELVQWHLSRDDRIEVTLEDFAQEDKQNLLAVRNGVIDTDTGELLPHGPHHMLMTFVDADYKPKAKCPRWEQVVLQASGGRSTRAADREEAKGWRDYMQRAMGYCITGRTDQQLMFVFFGESNAGKSVLLDTITSVLGSRLAIPLSDHAVQAGGYSERYELANLLGKRIAYLPEIDPYSKLDVELLKRLSGEDTVTARQIRREPITFRSQAKLIFVGNALPKVDPQDEAFWRRVKVLPFPHVVPRDERDPDLKEALRAEREGILAWLVRGAMMAQERRLKDHEPAVVAQAIAKYRGGALGDPLETWLAECTIPEGREATAELHASYMQHAMELLGVDADELLSRKGFALRLDRKGYAEAARIGNKRYRRGISLKE